MPANRERVIATFLILGSFVPFYFGWEGQRSHAMKKWKYEQENPGYTYRNQNMTYKESESGLLFYIGGFFLLGGIGIWIDRLANNHRDKTDFDLELNRDDEE